MNFVKTDIDGVWIIEPRCFGDNRGYFMESYKQHEFNAAIGREINFVQDNESMSRRAVLRGLHFQKGEASQAKLVRVSEGRVIDIAVDLRRSSPTFCKYIAVELSEDNHRQLFVPRGFAHGFLVLSDVARFQYKVDNTYCPEAEVTLRFDDVTIGVDWASFGIATSDFVLSAKDTVGADLDTLKANNILFD
jgi:dTDP-4-dehydrorhamnose 3,5-epimerase